MAYLSVLVRRTLALLIGGFITLGLVVAASLWLSREASVRSANVAEMRQFRNLAANLFTELLNAETSQRGYLLTLDRDYLAPYQAALPRVADTLRRLPEAPFADRARADIGRVTALSQAKLNEMSETIGHAEAGRTAEALEIVKSDRGQQIMVQIRGALDSILASVEVQISGELGRIRDNASALIWVNVAATLVVIVLVALATVIVGRYTRELVRARQEVEATNAGLDARVKERTLDLTRANDEIQRFAYIVSHDLRAPLVNILGFTSEFEKALPVLQRFHAAAASGTPDPALAKEAETAVNADLPEAIGFIRASGTKMDRLIGAILKLSREGRRPINPEPVALGALFDATAASLQHQLADREIRIEIARPQPTIVSDRLSLEQIFGNLIDNAVKYMANGRKGLIRITTKEDPRDVVVEIEDNGRGIAAGDHERIFELFRRSGPQDRPGEGIGLAHVRALARRLGGDVTVESQLGQGSRFIVRLPRRTI